MQNTTAAQCCTCNTLMFVQNPEANRRHTEGAKSASGLQTQVPLSYQLLLTHGVSRSRGPMDA